LYPSDQTDIGKRVLLQGTDNNGNQIYSQDGFNQVSGIFVVLAQPFVDCPIQFNTITGIQKDITNGPVILNQADPVSGAEVQLSVMAGGEESLSYRRYYLDKLPCGCCPTPGASDDTLVQVTGIAKMEPIPVVVDTDYMLLQNQEAIIEECQAVRYSTMDVLDAKTMASQHHTNAIRYLNGELGHYLGTQNPAVSFSPFGTARLERQGIGTMI
jgi:hypothetical protein